MCQYDYESLRAEAIAKGLPRYVYEPIEEPLVSEAAWEHLPTYYQGHVAERNARVQARLRDLRNYEAFVFFADAHVRQNGMVSVPVLRSILTHTDVKTVIYGGDTVSAWVTEETMCEDVDYFCRAYSFAAPYMVRGNHDMYGKAFGYAEEGTLKSNKEVYDRIFRSGAARVCGEAGKTYYYFDRPDTKTRFIVIDTSDVFLPVRDAHGAWDCEIDVSREQIEWFIALLQATPRDYAVIVCGHIPFFRPLKWSHPKVWIFGELIDAFQRRTRYRREVSDGNFVEADFTAAQGCVVLTMCGHGHVDDCYISSGGCINLEIHCDAYQTNNGGSPMERNRGSESEIAMDVVILDRDTNRVTVVRYGVDRPLAMRQLLD